MSWHFYTREKIRDTLGTGRQLNTGTESHTIEWNHISGNFCTSY